MKNRWAVSAVVIVSLAMPAIPVGAQTASSVPDVFTWSGQLIAFDVDARVITVKAPVRGDQAVTELREFLAGDRILLTWSGYDSQGVAIARAVRFDPASNWNQPFTFPAEFVKYEAGSQFLTFTVEAPDTNFAELKSLKPGGWVTSTARQRPSSENNTVATATP
jgi:hypothetical protein